VYCVFIENCIRRSFSDTATYYDTGTFRYASILLYDDSPLWVSCRVIIITIIVINSLLLFSIPCGLSTRRRRPIRLVFSR